MSRAKSRSQQRREAATRADHAGHDRLEREAHQAVRAAKQAADAHMAAVEAHDLEEARQLGHAGAKILVAYVHPGSVRAEFMESYVGLLRQTKYAIATISVESGPLVGRSRNTVLDNLVTHDAEYILFIDTDMKFEPSALDELVMAEKDIVSGLCYGLDGTKEAKFIAASVKDENGDYRSPLETPETGYMPVDGVGMAFTLIKREVIEALRGANPRETDPQTFAKTGWPFGEAWEDGRMMGEDIAFCVRARELGFSSWVAIETRVGHVKSFVI